MICSKIDCTCPATKRPVLSFAAKIKPNGPRATAEVGLVVCDQHAVADPAEYVTDEGWRQICEGLRRAGKAEPDRRTLQVTYQPLQ